MKCPVCATSFKSETVSGVQLDICSPGCGGIWFDQFEFKKFDEKHEPVVESKVQIKVQSASQVSTHHQDLHNCPKCQDVKMMRHFSSLKRKVLIDQCPKCAGVWLDAGELTAIRNEYESEAERKAAAEAVFDDLFKNSKQKPQSSLQGTAQTFAKIFRFISPSYYLGKK